MDGFSININNNLQQQRKYADRNAAYKTLGS